MRAFGGEAFGNRGADAARGAGYQRDAVVQTPGVRHRQETVA
jgi:guanyl-specific ribonuclease Sa